MDVTSALVTLEQVCLSCTLIYRETLLRRRVSAKAVLSQVGQVDGGELLIHISGITRVDSRPASSTTFYNHRERETVCATTSYKCTTHRIQRGFLSSPTSPPPTTNLRSKSRPERIRVHHLVNETDFHITKYGKLNVKNCSYLKLHQELLAFSLPHFCNCLDNHIGRSFSTFLI